jgi:hypothetical protein
MRGWRGLAARPECRCTEGKQQSTPWPADEATDSSTANQLHQMIQRDDAVLRHCVAATHLLMWQHELLISRSILTSANGPVAMLFRPVTPLQGL